MSVLRLLNKQAQSSKNKKSYTLTGKGHLSSLDDQKGQNVKVTIKGFK